MSAMKEGLAAAYEAGKEEGRRMAELDALRMVAAMLDALSMDAIHVTNRALVAAESGILTRTDDHEGGIWWRRT